MPRFQNKTCVRPVGNHGQVDDLLHGPAGAEAEGFEFDLGGGDAVDEEDHVVAVVGVVGVDAELVDDLEGVLAPVFDVDEGVVEGGAIVAGEAASLAEAGGGGEDVGGDDLVEEALELAVGEFDAVEGFEVPPEVLFERGAVADVGTEGVLEGLQLVEEVSLKLGFGGGHGGVGRHRTPVVRNDHGERIRQAARACIRLRTSAPLREGRSAFSDQLSAVGQRGRLDFGFRMGAGSVGAGSFQRSAISGQPEGETALGLWLNAEG